MPVEAFAAFRATVADPRSVIDTDAAIATVAAKVGFPAIDVLRGP